MTTPMTIGISEATNCSPGCGSSSSRSHWHNVTSYVIGRNATEDAAGRTDSRVAYLERHAHQELGRMPHHPRRPTSHPRWRSGRVPPRRLRAHRPSDPETPASRNSPRRCNCTTTAPVTARHPARRRRNPAGHRPPPHPGATELRDSGARRVPTGHPPRSAPTDSSGARITSPKEYHRAHHQDTGRTSAPKKAVTAAASKIFGREAPLWLALIAASVKLASTFWLHLSNDQQILLNAAAAATAGFIVAFLVRDGIQAAVLGFAQAGLALGVGFGLDMPAEHQAVLLSFVAVAIGMFERTQVTAPVPADPTAANRTTD